MDIIEKIFKIKRNIVAYRVVEIQRVKTERMDPHAGSSAVQALFMGQFSLAFDSIKYGLKTTEEREIIFKFLELIDVNGDTYYVYENQKGYEFMCKLLDPDRYSKVFYSNLQVLKWIHDKKARLYKIEELENAICGNIYRLESCEIYLWKKLGVEQFLDWWGNEKASDKYCLGSPEYFLEKNKIFCERLCEDELKRCKTEWENVYTDIDKNTKLVEDLKEDLWEVRESYKKAIYRAKKKLSYIQKRKEEELNKEEKNLIKEAGEKGEEIVQYALKWLPSEYVVINNENNGGNSIRIKNDEFINETQEIDHIVIGPQGIFLIETKNYVGKITIDTNGNWIREKRHGVLNGEKSPLQQIRCHEKVIKSIVPDIDIISVLCMAHPKVIIVGEENFPVKVVKSDLLCEFIETYQSHQILSAKKIQNIVEMIRKKIVS